MVRRTGLIPEPPAQRQQIIDNGNPMPSNADLPWRVLGEQARRLNSALQPLRDQATQQIADADVAAGREELRIALTREDELYNNVITQGYVARQQASIADVITRVETEAAGDPVAFGEALQDARAGFIGEANPQFSGALAEEFDRVASNALTRVQATARQAAVESAQANIRYGLQRIENELLTVDPASEEADRLLRQYREVADAAAANPLSGMSPAEAGYAVDNLSHRHRAAWMADHAVDEYVARGGNAEAAAAVIEELDGAINELTNLDETQRDRYLRSSIRAIRSAESQRRANEAAISRDINMLSATMRQEARDLIAQTDAYTERHVPAPPERMEELAEAVALSNSPALARQYRELAIRNAALENVQGMNARDIERYIGQYNAEVGEEGIDPDRAYQLNIAIDEMQEYLRWMQNNGAMEVAQTHADAPPPSIQDDEVYDLGQRVRYADDFAIRNGTRRSYLTQTEAGALRDRIANAPPEEAVRLLRQITESSGARAVNVLREVDASEEGPLFAIGQAMLNGMNDTVAGWMAQGLRARQNAAPGYEAHVFGDMNREERQEEVADYLPANTLPQGLALVQQQADLIIEGWRLHGLQEVTPQTYRGAINMALGGRTIDGVRFGGIAQNMPRRTSVVAPTYANRDTFGRAWMAFDEDDFRALGSGALPQQGEVNDWRGAILVPDGQVGRYKLMHPQGGIYRNENGGPFIIDFNLPAVRAYLQDTYPNHFGFPQ